MKVMSAIEACRTEALGGHVAGCAKCGHHHIAYNSCKNRYCPKCQGPAARDWMAARAEDLLPVECFHVVFTLPAEIARIAYWNKRAVYGLLFKASAQTVITIAADPTRMGARVGMTSVLHTWVSALTPSPIPAQRWLAGWGPPASWPIPCPVQRARASPPAARRPKLPLIVMTRDTQVSRRMALVWGARSVLEASASDYESMVQTAKEECQKLLAPKQC